MSAPANDKDRERQVRRTTTARRGVMAAGAVGALGAAVGIGISTQTADAADTSTSSVTENHQGDQDGTAQQDSPQDDQQWSQPRSDDQLAAPGGSAPAQGHSGGS